MTSSNLISVIFILASFMVGSALATVRVKTDVTVNGDVVRLGDVFEGLDEKADEVVCAAPEPGKNLTINVDQLRFLALNHGLDWHSSSEKLEISVERASRIFTEEEILAAIEEKIMPTLSSDYNHLLSLDRNTSQIVVPIDFEDDLVVEEVKIKNKRFQARFSPNVNRTVMISGRIQSLVEVPTLVRAVNPGETILDDDIEMAEATESDVRGRVILQRADLIGTTPRNGPILPGKLIRFADVQKPLLIERGSSVKMTFKSGTLSIAGTGQALQNGSMGEVVRIMNTESRKVVQGLVTGPGKVEVGVAAS